jgi:hypothetical protein
MPPPFLLTILLPMKPTSKPSTIHRRTDIFSAFPKLEQKGGRQPQLQRWLPYEPPIRLDPGRSGSLSVHTV